MLRGSAVSALLLLIVLSGSGCDTTNSQTGAKGKKPSVPVVPGPVDADAPEEFTTTESGLKYRIRRKSDGKQPTAKSLVTVHYRGWLDDGEIFETTYGTGGTPSQFGVGKVVPGWSEGLQLIGEGGMIELEIPSDLGYGHRSQPPAIPSNSTLHFIMELIKVGADVQPPDPQKQEGPDRPGSEASPSDDMVPAGFTATASGLKYKVTKESKGRKPNVANTVKVHYRGTLTNGTVFDDSYKRGKPAEFPLSGVIVGWTEGLQLVGEGGSIELLIPGKLGYPDGQPPTIPPNATLHFTIDLLEVK